MEVMQILHMNKGNGETSYAKNSTVQSNIISLGRTIMDESLKKLMTTTINDNKTNINQFDKISIGIADLGCSSGPNSLLSVSNIVDTIHTLCLELESPVPELRICLNDLFNNDFNYIFASLPEFYERIDHKKEGSRIFGPCFVSAVPGSFYGRVFPRRSLHFVHSSSSLHWLSQVPRGNDVDKDAVMNNKGKLYISKTSPESVHKAYALQFKKDFSSFLESRSEELISGGRMVLSFLGRNSSDPTTEESCYQWELLAQALMSLANEGKIEEKEIDSFNAPYYAASSEEIKDIIEKNGSFSIDRFEMNNIDWEGLSVCDESYDLIRTKPEALASGLRVANTIRAVVEPMLKPKFGENVMDELFLRYAKIVGDYFYENLPQYSSVVVSLVRME